MTYLFNIDIYTQSERNMAFSKTSLDIPSLFLSNMMFIWDITLSAAVEVAWTDRYFRERLDMRGYWSFLAFHHKNGSSVLQTQTGCVSAEAHSLQLYKSALKPVSPKAVSRPNADNVDQGIVVDDALK